MISLLIAAIPHLGKVAQKAVRSSFALSLVLLFCGYANAAVVDFEEVINPAIQGQSAYGRQGWMDATHLISGGLTFMPTYHADNIAVNSAEFLNQRTIYKFANNGSNTLSSYSGGGIPAFGLLSTNLINLHSIDFAEYGSTSMPSVTTSLLVTGYFQDGNSISRMVNLDGIVDGGAGADDFQTELFDSSWSNLALVEIGSIQSGRAIFYTDNFDYDPTTTFNQIYDTYLLLQSATPNSIPEPIPLALLALGLAGIVTLRRNRER